MDEEKQDAGTGLENSAECSRLAASTCSTAVSRPILFSGPMVKAILEGRKTMTRRVAAVTDEGCKPGFITPTCGFVPRKVAEHATYCPYGRPGDHLWVRETWVDLRGMGVTYLEDGEPCNIAYAADTKPGSDGDKARIAYGIKWKPSIFMPRTASRITLEITNVRVERLQNITEEDAEQEGVASNVACLIEFHKLWESINGKKYPWASNPWVWVIEFKRV
jgi:hypothetical protein